MVGVYDPTNVLDESTFFMKVAERMEEQVDSEIAKLEQMDEDELEVLKRKRIGRHI